MSPMILINGTIVYSYVWKENSSDVFMNTSMTLKIGIKQDVVWQVNIFLKLYRFFDSLRRTKSW